MSKGSSVAGLSFEFYSGGPYPAEYDGAMFMADYSRNCIWVMTKGADGLPDRLKVKPFVSNAAGPVDVQIHPRASCTTPTSTAERSAASSTAAPRR